MFQINPTHQTLGCVTTRDLLIGTSPSRSSSDTDWNIGASAAPRNLSSRTRGCLLYFCEPTNDARSGSKTLQKSVVRCLDLSHQIILTFFLIKSFSHSNVIGSSSCHVRLARAIRLYFLLDCRMQSLSKWLHVFENSIMGSAMILMTRLGCRQVQRANSVTRGSQ